MKLDKEQKKELRNLIVAYAKKLAVLGCAACSNEADFVKTEADNNSIGL